MKMDFPFTRQLIFLTLRARLLRLSSEGTRDNSLDLKVMLNLSCYLLMLAIFKKIAIKLKSRNKNKVQFPMRTLSLCRCLRIKYLVIIFTLYSFTATLQPRYSIICITSTSKGESFEESDIFISFSYRFYQLLQNHFFLSFSMLSR